MDRECRRRFVVGVSALLAAPLAIGQSAKPLRIAVLLPGTYAAYRPRLKAFSTELGKLGYAEGRDIVLEPRWAEDRIDRLHTLAEELVSLQPAVILTASSAGVIACKKATSAIPIVFATASLLVEQGLVSNLARPGGNVTGVTVHSLNGKIVELAREALPQVRKLAILVYDSDPASRSTTAEFRTACVNLKFEPVVARVPGVEELASTFDQIARDAQALYLPGIVFSLSHADYLITRSLQSKLPLFTTQEAHTVSGGLLSYSTDRSENFRRAAGLVDKILRGAKPGDLPIEQPERLRLVINLKTAKAMGIAVARSLLLRADRVIE